MCRTWLLPPNIPYLWQAPRMYGVLTLACVCFVTGWFLVWLNHRHAAQIHARVVQYHAALGVFALTVVLLIIAYVGWSQLEVSWYDAYHTLFIADHCDPTPIVKADLAARVTHVAILLSTIAVVIVGIVLAWQGREAQVRALQSRG